jgi:hypothetical protein
LLRAKRAFPRGIHTDQFHFLTGIPGLCIMNDGETKQTRETKRYLHPIESIAEPITRKQAYWHITKVIMYCQFFLIAHVLLTVSLCVNSASPYYLWFYIPIPVIHYLSTLLLFVQKKKWSTQDVRTLLEGNFAELCASCTRTSGNYRPFTSWASWRFVLLLYAFGIWWKPLMQYTDKFDPPTNSSSCTTDYVTEGDNPYNPAGFFNKGMPFSLQIQLKFCPMDQTFAYPVLNNVVLGYAAPLLETDVTTLCANPLTPNPVSSTVLVNGYPDTDKCINEEHPLGAYPSPVLGLTPRVRLATPNPEIVICKGNTAQEVCLSADGSVAYPLFSAPCPVNHRTGAPRKICPVCLNYWRRIAANPTGPSGYEHCSPYREDESYYPFCYFCPGRGYGIFAHERYDNQSLTINLALSTTIMGALLLEMIGIFVLVNLWVPDIRIKVVSPDARTVLLGADDIR